MSEILAEVFVPGRPRPKGSMKCTGGNGRAHRMEEDNPESKPWRRQMAHALVTDRDRRDAPTGPCDLPYPGEVDVSVIAFFPQGGPTPGDVDKLARNVLDALQDAVGGSPAVLADDAQVVGLLSERTVCAGGEQQGVWIRVSTVAPEEWRRRQMLREAARCNFLLRYGFGEETGL